MSASAQPSLPAYALFAATLACAGLPIYIHAPKFYADTYGVGLTALASVLFGLRLLDLIQDPFFGWVVARRRGRRGAVVGVAGLVLAAAMLALFAIGPPVAPLLWFALMMTALFSAFSFLSIAMYAQGVSAAERIGPGGHLRLAAWREAGALLGVCAASLAPFLLGFPGFAFGFAVLTAAALLAMRKGWSAGDSPGPSGFRAVLGDPLARRLLVIALLNAAPVAVSSTLFLFYVESALAAPGWEGAYLILFFIMAALAAPLWTRLAARFGSRPMLFAAMVLAILGFSFVLSLGPGDRIAFAIVCVVTGFALGADFALLPAAFAARMAVISPEAGAGFGLWAFASKATLAFAAIVLLPALDMAGFEPGAAAPDGAIDVLVYLYAGVPCILKLGAMAVLAITPLPGAEGKEEE